ncbi:MAG: arginine--tRNA ligase [Thermoplasmatales archaeon]
MKPYSKFDEMARRKMDSYLSKHNFNLNYRIYRAPKGFGDLTFDFQKSNVNIDGSDIQSLSDDNLSFKAVGKFVNVLYNDNEFSIETLRSASSGELFSFEKRGEKILVEHTSANPTGPLHIGRVRNSIIGDTISRLLMKYGYEVKTEYYVNDIGTQVEALLLGTDLFKDMNYTDSYRKVFENFDLYKTKVEELMLRAESGDEAFIKDSRHKLSLFLDDVLSDLSKLSISFDIFIWESDFILDGSVKRLLERLSGIIKDDNGAKYIETEGGKIYLIRSNGTSVYFTRDVAHHILKASKFNRSIDVLGEDHKDHYKKLEYVFNLLGLKGIEAVFYSFISTKEGKMSTRRGNVVYVRDLIEEAIFRARNEIIARRSDLNEDELREISTKIGTAAVRYNIIKYSLEKPVVFDWKEALNFEGDAAPFVMYSYARAKSILSKIKEQNEIKYHFKKEEYPILRLIALYPEVIEDAASHLRPDRVAKYAFELAGTFNQFYRDCEVIGSGEDQGRRAEIVKAFAKTMEEVFFVLGINPSDKI